MGDGSVQPGRSRALPAAQADIDSKKYEQTNPRLVRDALQLPASVFAEREAEAGLCRTQSPMHQTAVLNSDLHRHCWSRKGLKTPH